MADYRTERRLLQCCIAVAGLVPVCTGTAGMLLGGAMLHDTVGPSLDSHLRYLSGLLCGLGLSFWYMIPTIERRTHTVRALTALVFLGGLARLAGALLVTRPSTSMLLAIGMELAVTPLLCLWQGRIAQRAGGTA